MKNKLARKCIYIQLKIISLSFEDKRFRDLPEEWFELPEDANLSNHIIFGLKYYELLYLEDKREFSKVQDICEDLLKNSSQNFGILKNELLCNLLFYRILKKCSIEEIDELLTVNLKKYITTSSDISKHRLLYAYYLLAKDDKEMAENELIKFNE